MEGPETPRGSSARSEEKACGTRWRFEGRCCEGWPPSVASERESNPKGSRDAKAPQTGFGGPKGGDEESRTVPRCDSTALEGEPGEGESNSREVGCAEGDRGSEEDAKVAFGPRRLAAALGRSKMTLRGGHMASFTHYWEGHTCKAAVDRGDDGRPLGHTASRLFSRRGVTVGSRVYVVNISKGSLFLIGRLEVGQIASREKAKRLLGPNLWDAPEHLIARADAGTPMRFRRQVPAEVTKRLLFESANESKPLKFVSVDALDGQTLRGVRRLSDSSAALLEEQLKETGVAR